MIARAAAEPARGVPLALHERAADCQLSADSMFPRCGGKAAAATMLRSGSGIYRDGAAVSGGDVDLVAAATIGREEQ